MWSSGAVIGRTPPGRNRPIPPGLAPGGGMGESGEERKDGMQIAIVTFDGFNELDSFIAAGIWGG